MDANLYVIFQFSINSGKVTYNLLAQPILQSSQMKDELFCEKTLFFIILNVANIIYQVFLLLSLPIMQNLQRDLLNENFANIQ